jgi:ribonuclease R
LREQAAAEAERAALKQKQAEYLKRFIGATRNGIVSGVSQSGIFVEDIATKTSGLVRFGSLPKDYYRIDERHYRVVGRQTKRHYQLGNAVKIKVLAADPITGYVDYEIVSQK